MNILYTVHATDYLYKITTINVLFMSAFTKNNIKYLLTQRQNALTPSTRKCQTLLQEQILSVPQLAVLHILLFQDGSQKLCNISKQNTSSIFVTVHHVRFPPGTCHGRKSITKKTSDRNQL
jgi:hypothetical protein